MGRTLLVEGIKEDRSEYCDRFIEQTINLLNA